MKKMMENLVFFLAIAGLVVGVHAGIKYGMPHYVFKVFESNAKELERISFDKLENFREKVITQMKADDVPVPFDNPQEMEKHLKVWQDREGIMRAEITWSVHVDYYGFFPRDFNFKVEVSR